VRRLPPRPDTLETFRLCARVANELRQVQDLGCHPLQIVEDAVAAEQDNEINALWVDSVQPGYHERVRGFLSTLPAGSLPELRARFVAAGRLTLTRDPEHLAEADRLLAPLVDNPGELEHPTLRETSALFHYALGELRLVTGDYEGAWIALERARREFAATGSARRIATIDLQSRIVSRKGATRYGIELLGRALDGCENRLSRCEARITPTIEANYAWYITSDPLSTPSELEIAHRLFEQARQRERQRGDREAELNQFINSILARTLLEAQRVGAPWVSDLGEEIQRATKMLRELPSGENASRLAGWIELLDAQRQSDPAKREAICHRIAATQDPRAGNPLPGLAALCAGRAALAQEDPHSADLSFERAKAHFEAAQDVEAGVPIGTSHRADAYYGSAASAIVAGDAGKAWHVLSTLDGQTIADCPTIRPASGAEFRTFWFDSTLWLLERAGERFQASRFHLERSDLVRVREELGRIVHRDEGYESSFAWDSPLRELATELFDRTQANPDAPIVLGLYGALQEFPLDAVRMADSKGSVGRILGAERLIVVRPACTAATEAIASASGNGLFVLNPTQDLLASNELAPLIEQQYADAALLRGGEATREVVLAELTDALFLHIDTHGVYDPIYPNRSMLELARGERFTLGRLAEELPPMMFANLSACQTGRSPTTAGSGLFGFGGAFLRSGTPWVITTQARVEDRIAQEFNEVFYRELASLGSSAAAVPAAYRTAIQSLREQYTNQPERWLMFRLLAGGHSTP